MSKRILVTGGAGFIGSAVARHIIRDTPHQVLVVDKLTYAGNLDSLAPVSNDPRYAFVRADIADAAEDARAVRELPARRRDASRGREPRRPLDRRAGRVHPDQRGRHLRAAAGRARLLARACRRPQRDAFRFHHISTDEVFGSLGERRPVLRDHRLRSALALLGLQGGLRPSGARLASHLRPAGDRDQLLEQLRALSFPREADPADDHQRARGPEAAGLRRRRQRARLALCRGSRARAAGRGARPASRARPTASAGAARGPISTWSRRSAR